MKQIEKEETKKNIDKTTNKTTNKTNKIEKIKPEVLKKNLSNDEPNWYHYLIVLFVLALIVGGIYFTLNYYKIDRPQTTNNKFINSYPYKVGNITYNIEFEHTFDEIKSFDYDIEVSKLDLLNTVHFRFVLLNYTGSDNGEVSRGIIKLTNFLRLVYHFQFGKDSFKMINELNCSNSTMTNKIIVFNPYSNRTGIYMDNSGCINFETDDPKKVTQLTDKFIYTTIMEN